MTAQSPHPLRCETCERCPFLHGAFFEFRTSLPLAKTTAQIGCASHSRISKAIGEMNRRIGRLSKYPGNTQAIRTYEEAIAIFSFEKSSDDYIVETMGE